MVAANVCAHLDRNDFEPLVIHMYKAGNSMTHILSDMGIPFYGVNLNRFSRFFRPFFVAHILNKLKIDVLHVHHTAMYMQAFYGIKLSNVKGTVFTEHANFRISKSAKLQSFCCKAAVTADYFTTISDKLKNYFTDELHINEQFIHVIPNGVDTDLFVPDTGRLKLAEYLPQKYKGKALIHVGRLNEAKDHLTLLRTMKLLVQEGHKIYLVLIGDGELRKTIEAEIIHLGLTGNVRLLGSMANIHELLPGGDIFILSSKREGLPLAILEAMSCGLPVVATNVGAISEIVDNNVNGVLVPAGNQALLAKKIAYLLENPQWTKSLARAGRETVKKSYGLKKMAESYAQLYRNIIQSYCSEACNP